MLDAGNDATIVVLLVSGVLSIGLDTAFGDQPNGWIGGFRV